MAQYPSREFHIITDQFYHRSNPEDYVPRKDQRKALNRWNKFILGQEYLSKAARLCPESKEYVHPLRRCAFSLSARSVVRNDIH